MSQLSSRAKSRDPVALLLMLFYGMESLASPPLAAALQLRLPFAPLGMTILI